jgi:hypothetical protein
MKRQILLVVLLLAVLGYAAYTYWPVLVAYFPDLIPQQATVKPGAKPAAVPAQTTTTQAQAAEAVEETAEAEARIEKPKTEKLVDPFMLRVRVTDKTRVTPVEEKKEVVKPPEPKLEGIWIDSDMKIAFISGQALIENGRIMGWTVKRISKTQVLLVKGKDTKILKLEGLP